jgi:hypothetical protein
MRSVVYVDKSGLKRRALLRDVDPDSAAEQGVPTGPPDLDVLDWDEIKMTLHNELADAGLWTWDDVQREQNGVQGVVRRVLIDRIIRLYRESVSK